MLPPLSGNSNDMTAILRKIEVMQTQISTLMEAQKTTSELISAQVCTEQPPESKTNDKSHEHVDDPQSIIIHGDVNTDSSSAASPDTKNAHEQRNISKEHDTTLYSDDLSSSLSQDSSDSSDEEEIKEEPVATHMHQTPKSLKAIAKPVQPKIKTRIFNASKKTIQPSTYNNNNQVASQTDYEANLWSNNPVGRPRVVQDSTIQGTGTAPGLRAVKRYNRQTGSNNADNRSCTGVFITRLRPHTNATDVETYIRHEIGMDMKAEKLPTRYNTYSSFYIRCSDPRRATLLDGRVWPTGSLVKPFFS